MVLLVFKTIMSKNEFYYEGSVHLGSSEGIKTSRCSHLQGKVKAAVSEPVLK